MQLVKQETNSIPNTLTGLAFFFQSTLFFQTKGAGGTSRGAEEMASAEEGPDCQKSGVGTAQP